MAGKYRVKTKQAIAETRMTLRLPEDIWANLTVQAESNQRSLNAEIVQRLRQSLEGYRRL